MPREYKLRLGDGTVLAVDEDGLRTWAIDGKAAAQAVGSAHWRPLKEVLAELAVTSPRSGSGGRRDDGIPIIPLKPIDAPPPAKDLPALRLAAADDEEADEDVYEGSSALSLAWVWTKRIVLVGVLAGGGVLAASTWPIWLPVVTQFGLVIFTKFDHYVHPEHARAPATTDEKQRQTQEALAAASGQLPYLSPETVQLVMSSSMWSVPDPPELFNRAYTAARRGSSALPVAEAEELKTLEAAMLAGLRPAERQRVREYDRVRLERATLPSEDREMLGLYARAARALPPPSRGRLQVLFGKAIAAGLAAQG